MIRTAPFETHVEQYEAWFDRYPHVFQSEIEAIRDFLPPGNSRGLEIGMGTGRYAMALGIKEGIEPVAPMRTLARRRGLEVMDARAEDLPYKDLSFDFVLMNFCISYFDNVNMAFREAHRVLRRGGVLIVGFVDRRSPLGREYEDKRMQSTFYRHANFYEPRTIIHWLQDVYFTNIEVRQTLFHPLERVRDTELSEPGFGKGSYVIIAAQRK